jgi:hypothetical protein
VTNWFVNNHSRYEKRNNIERCCSGRWPYAGFVLEHPRDHHDHNASNHGGNGSAASSDFANDDDNNAHGRRLLIDGAGRSYSCCRHGPVGRVAVSKGGTEFDRPQAGGYSRDALRVFGRSPLRFALFLPPPDSRRARSLEVFRHCGDPSASRPLCFVQRPGSLSPESGRAGLCW